MVFVAPRGRIRLLLNIGVAGYTVGSRVGMHRCGVHGSECLVVWDQWENFGVL